MRKGIAKILLILIVAAAVIIFAVMGLPVMFDSSVGETTKPDSPLYDLELAGEGIKCSLTVDRKDCLLALAEERDREAAEMKELLNRIFEEGEITRYRLLILQTENNANRLRIEALGD